MKVLDDEYLESMLKNFIWTVVLIISVAYFVVSYILPSVGLYKQHKYNSRNSDKDLNRIREVYSAEKSGLRDLVSSNENVLRAFHTKYSAEQISRLLSNHLVKVNVRLLSEQDNTKLQISESIYRVEGRSDSITGILDIPKILQDGNISAVLTLPVSMHKRDDGNGYLDFTLSLSIVSSIYRHDPGVLN